MATPTSAEWRHQLDAELTARQPNLDLYERYFQGDHRLAFATSKFKEAFGELFAAFATNWCTLVVDAAVQRLAIQGFRFADEESADDDAWAIWQANRLDAEAIKAHTDAVKLGTSYLYAGPPVNGVPRITVEHATQVVVAHDPADRSRRLAALKKYRAANGDSISVVWTPETVSVFRAGGAAQSVAALGVVLPVGTGDYRLVKEDRNRLGVVPMVPLENAPGTMTGGVSDLKPAISLNDAANKFFTDMLVASEYQAFRQRVLSGVEVPKYPEGHPEAGKPMPIPIEMAVSRMLVLEETDAKAYDLSPGDLSNYVQGIDLAVQHLAAQTQTPPHYLLAKLVNISGEALTAAETGLVSRVRRKHIDFSDPWEEAMRLAFKWRSLEDGSPTRDADVRRAEAMDTETIWRDPETRAPGVISDSLVKKGQIGVPWQALMEEAGYSPTQIKRMRAMRERELQEAEISTLFNGLPADQGSAPDTLPIGGQDAVPAV
jgi:hypothetical protein